MWNEKAALRMCLRAAFSAPTIMPGARMKNSLKPAALGFRAHSGWAALVGVSLEEGFPVPLLRERPHLVKTFTFEFRQPYHTAEKKPFEEAAGFIAHVRAEADALALDAIQSAQANLAKRGFELHSCGLLTSAARSLPDLEHILASHPLIHTADGELFRESLVQACRRLELPVLVIREKDLLERAGLSLRLSASELTSRLAQAGRVHGSPWTQDEKFAALAACLAGASEAKQIVA